MNNLLKSILRLERRGVSWVFAAMALVGITLLLASATKPAAAQTAGEGSIEGTVTDSTGAVVPHAKVTITNVATGVSQVQESTGAGFFSIAPVLPGTYTVQIVAKGFETLVQDNVAVDAMQVRTLSPKLVVGAETQTVTVTGAPPVLDTADATIGLTVENATYSNLPIQMSNAQRDPTAFGVLTPGAQGGSRLPVVNGTGNYLGQLYVDGMPAETVSQQGDNRLVSLTMDIDAVDQFQMVTSTPPAEYAGAGAENFTMKSGGLQYHGQVSDFVRNTAFDSWGFTAPHATEQALVNGVPMTVAAPKPAEHQNELSASAGGVVPFTHKKLFFFGAYDRYHERKGATYSLINIPSNLMTQGNFTEVACFSAGGNCAGSGVTGTGSNNPPVIYDPTSTTCPGGICTRSPFEYNGTYNVIPPGEISTISKNLQQFLPSASSSNTYYSDWVPSVLQNNYLSGWPSGFDNWVADWRVDYDLKSNQRISSVGTIGTENYLNNYGAPLLPPPLIGGDLANIYPKNFIVEDAYTITPNLVNQLKYSFTRFFQNIHDATAGTQAWTIGAMGITNLPGGQGGLDYPELVFGNNTSNTTFGSIAETTFRGSPGSNSTQLTTPNNYAVTDNVQWLKGRHALTMGLTYQWQEINDANPATLTGGTTLNYNPFSTSNFNGTAGNTLVDTANGFSYASFLIGATGGSSSTDATNSSQSLLYVSETGGRYKAIAPYVRDSFKMTSKLTLDLGLRWDYLPPFHEVKDRWTFLNPTAINPLTNTPGILQFAGDSGGSGVSCQCKTPVHTYWKNWGPRVGAAYTINSKTVVRAGFGIAFTQAGGVGGRGGAYQGTGATGFNTSVVGPTGSIVGPTAGPAYYLNNDSSYLGAAANTGLFGGAAYPAAPSPSVTAQELNTGFISSGSTFKSASGVSFADPYVSGRAPELVLYNFGFERAITPSMTAGVNYVGNETHFIIDSTTNAANARGYWTNELNPTYLAALGGVEGAHGAPLLASQADAADLAILNQYMPNAPQPAFYTNSGAGSNSSSATIQQMLVAFPQYNGVTDLWGNVSNFAYNSLQLMIQQRPAHGLTFNFNYTYAKNLGDDGTFRSGWPLAANVISRSNGGGTLSANRIDRSWTAISIPQTINVFGVYQLPFGKGQLGGDNAMVRWLAGGWQLSEIYNYTAGAPLAVTGGASSQGQGQVMPDLNPGFVSSSARENGSYGSGPGGYTYANLGKIQYVNPNAFISAVNVSPGTGTSTAECIPGASSNLQPSKCTGEYLIGNAPRTAAYGLRGPGNQNLNAGLRRSFPLGRNESRNFVFEASCFNVWNKVTFGSPSASWSYGSGSFGTTSSASSASGGGPSGARDWQFAGHINF
jgi:hypothetical protein